MNNIGITPYLNVNTDDLGNAESLSSGVTFTIPNTPVNINLQNGYLGADFDFGKFGLGLSYQPGNKEDIVGGWSSKTDVSKSIKNFNPNTKFGATLIIPIGQ